MAEGWAFSYKILAEGERQIVNFHIPGDFLGVRSVLFRTTDHNVEPITPIEASEVTKEELFQTFAKTPRLASASAFGTQRPATACGLGRQVRRCATSARQD